MVNVREIIPFYGRTIQFHYGLVVQDKESLLLLKTQTLLQQPRNYLVKNTFIHQPDEPQEELRRCSSQPHLVDEAFDEASQDDELQRVESASAILVPGFLPMSALWTIQDVFPSLTP